MKKVLEIINFSVFFHCFIDTEITFAQFPADVSLVLHFLDSHTAMRRASDCPIPIHVTSDSQADVQTYRVSVTTIAVDDKLHRT